MEQEFINIMGAIIILMMGWWLRVIWESINKVSKNLKDLERKLPDTYLRRDDYRDDITDIKEMLSKIFDRLDQKADK